MEKAQQVKEKSDSLYNAIQDFKIGLIADADGDKADPNGENIEKKDKKL